MVEKERGSSELYEGKVVLQVAPGVVLLQVRALGKGREHKKGENKTGDGIAFLFRDRSGTVVVRLAVALSFRAPTTFPQGRR